MLLQDHLISFCVRVGILTFDESASSLTAALESSGLKDRENSWIIPVSAPDFR